MKKKSPILPSAHELLELIKKRNRPLRLDAILEAASIPRHGKKLLDQMLHGLETEGQLVRMPGGVWVIPSRLKSVTGVFHALPTGGGNVASTDGRHIISIPPRQTFGAWHKDIVRAFLNPGKNSGKIVEILERPTKTLAAIIQKKSGSNILCKPVDRHLHLMFTASLKSNSGLAKKACPGVLVSLRPLQEVEPGLWRGSLENIYGAEENVDVQEAIVKQSHDVPADFPPLALEQAAACGISPAQSDMVDRINLRHIPFVTIDGEDARDFDDAIHVEKTKGGWLLRVAIADVSHYVKADNRPGSLDAEARRRGNSWYFPRSVEPMLPRGLSNGLCSLRPGEDRLAMLAEISFTRDGSPVSSTFAPIVMRSAARLTYSEAAAILSDKRDGATHSDSPIKAMLHDAFELYKILALRRRQRGSLDFDLPEPAYTFNSAGHLESVEIAQRTDANMLIEEFMIAANEAVAEYLGARRSHFLYRVHPEPEPAKLAALFETLKLAAPEILPSGIQKDGKVTPHTLQSILAKANGTPKEFVVNRLCLRSMPQARYQSENIGHFGLASAAYCHFTSPIRRYADLLVHRALKASLAMKGFAGPDNKILDEIGENLNNLERQAMDCEREMARRLACLALKGQEGRIVKGTISGVTDFGLFVEFEKISAEGLLRIQELGGDWYELDKPAQCLIGLHTGYVWRLGDVVETKIRDVDLERMEIRLALLAPPRPHGKKSKRMPPHGPKKSCQSNQASNRRHGTSEKTSSPQKTGARAPAKARRRR